jgi:hypothetical protein
MVKAPENHPVSMYVQLESQWAKKQNHYTPFPDYSPIPTYILRLKTNQKNPRKLRKTNVQNMWQKVTSYLPCRFEIGKAVSNSKNESTYTIKFSRS